MDEIIRTNSNHDDSQGNSMKLTTHLMKSSAGPETVNVYSDSCIVDLSIGIGKSCSRKIVSSLAYCCDADYLWPHRRIAMIIGARQNIEVKSDLFGNIQSMQSSYLSSFVAALSSPSFPAATIIGTLLS
jgi:hypothetical protein